MPHCPLLDCHYSCQDHPHSWQDCNAGRIDKTKPGWPDVIVSKVVLLSISWNVTVGRGLLIVWPAQPVAGWLRVKYKPAQKSTVAICSFVDLSSFAGTDRVKYLLILPDKQSSHKLDTISLMTDGNSNFEGCLLLRSLVSRCVFWFHLSSPQLV